MIPDNQLARGIQSESIRGLGAEPQQGSVRSEAPNKNEKVQGAEPPRHKKMSELVCPESTTKVKYKIDYNSKIARIKLMNSKIRFRILRIF